MKTPSEIVREIFSRKKSPGTSSKFENFDLGGRFECTLSAVSGTGECADLFLDVYSPDALRGLIARAGIMGHLAKKGVPEPVIETEKDAAGIHRLRIYFGAPAPERLLVDLRLSRLVYQPDERLVGGTIQERRFSAIAIEWICFQDPRASFTPARPRLPGQNYPGLGAVRHLAPLMRLFAADLNADAVLDVPERYHAAVMYSGSFRFTDPAREGMLRAAIRDLGTYPLAEVSRAFDAGAVRDAATGAPAAYVPSEQVLPVTKGLAGYFASKRYREAVEAAAKTRLVIGRRAGGRKKGR